VIEKLRIHQGLIVPTKPMENSNIHCQQINAGIRGKPLPIEATYKNKTAGQRLQLGRAKHVSPKQIPASVAIDCHPHLVPNPRTRLLPKGNASLVGASSAALLRRSSARMERKVKNNDATINGVAMASLNTKTLIPIAPG
jgi:hypothetical protein